MRECTVSAKGQIKLPKDVQRALGLEAGGKVRFFITKDEVRLIKALPVAALEGILQRPGQAAISLEDM